MYIAGKELDRAGAAIGGGPQNNGSSQRHDEVGKLKLTAVDLIEEGNELDESGFHGSTSFFCLEMLEYYTPLGCKTGCKKSLFQASNGQNVSSRKIRSVSLDGGIPRSCMAVLQAWYSRATAGRSPSAA